MQDPVPENISGQKVQQHVFKHEIQWGYVALAVVLLLVMLKLSDVYASSREDGESGGSSGVSGGVS